MHRQVSFLMRYWALVSPALVTEPEPFSNMHVPTVDWVHVKDHTQCVLQSSQISLNLMTTLRVPT